MWVASSLPVAKVVRSLSFLPAPKQKRQPYFALPFAEEEEEVDLDGEAEFEFEAEDWWRCDFAIQMVRYSSGMRACSRSSSSFVSIVPAREEVAW